MRRIRSNSCLWSLTTLAVVAGFWTRPSIADNTSGPLLPADTLEALLVTSKSLESFVPDGKKVVDVTGQSFDKAASISVVVAQKEGTQIWDAIARVRTTAVVTEGQKLRMRLHLKGQPATGETGPAKVALSFGQSNGPWLTSFHRVIELTGEWQSVDETFPVKGTDAAGEAEVKLLMAYLSQTVEIGGISLEPVP
jgi:hypothetical protein